MGKYMGVPCELSITQALEYIKQSKEKKKKNHSIVNVPYTYMYVNAFIV